MQLIDAYVKRIDELMKEKNWKKLSQLTEQSAVPSSTLSNVMNKKSKSCNLYTVLNICRGFNITFKQFFDSELFDLENLDDD